MPKDEVVHISELKFDPRNARRRTERSAYVIRNSLEKFGGMRSLVIDDTNTVRAGNGTLEEAGQVGIEKVRIVEVDGNELVAVRRKGLSDKEWKEYAAADNRSSELSVWDTEVLNELSEEIDMSWMFTEAELDRLDTEFQMGLLEQEEEAEEPIESGVSGERYPLSIVLSYSEFQEWKIIKSSLNCKKDREAFLKLMRGESA